MDQAKEHVGAVHEDAALYNFGRSGQISNDQMRAITMVNDGIARTLTDTLGAWLRSHVAVTLSATEQQTYGEFVGGLPEPTYLCLLTLQPLGGVGLLQLDLTLAMAVIDVLLGGRGIADQIREVTDIEQEILASVLIVIMRELNAAWETVGLKFSLEKREAPGQVSRLMPASERMLTVVFQVSMGDSTGMLKLCLPAVVLNTIHRRLIAVKEQPRRSFEAGSARVTELLGNATVRATLRLPSFRLSSSEISRLAPGYILQLGVSRNTAVEFLVEGVRLASALPISQGDRRAAMLERRAHKRFAAPGTERELSPSALPAPATNEIQEGEVIA